MKNLFIAYFLSIGFAANAQDSIPDITAFTKKLMTCFQQKDKACFKTYLPAWKDMEPIYDSALAKSKRSADSLRSIPTRDSAKVNIEKDLPQELDENLDSLMARSERSVLNWSIASIKDGSKINNDMPQGMRGLDGKFSITLQDTTYSIRFYALLLNKQWKLIDMEERITVYDKEMNDIGFIAESFNSYDLSPVVDSAMAITDTVIKDIELSEIKKDAPPPPPAPKSKKKPLKKTTTTKKEMRKPE